MRLYILSFVLVCATVSFADDVTFTASVTQNQVATGERFQIEFVVNSNGNGFVAPDLSNFRILSGPNQSSSMSWINGAMSAKVSYSFILMAVEVGEFTFGPASIREIGRAHV